MSPQTVVNAKVGVLESIIVFLLRQEALRNAEPVKAIDSLAASFLQNDGSGSVQEPPEAQIAEMIVREVIESIFDRAKSAVLRELHRGA